MIALEPIPLTAFILILASKDGVQKGAILASKDGVQKGAAFIFGWLLSLAMGQG